MQAFEFLRLKDIHKLILAEVIDLLSTQTDTFGAAPSLPPAAYRHASNLVPSRQPDTTGFSASPLP
jgi:hypothetical protein